MHRFTRLITAIFLTILSIILLFSSFFAYLIVTPLGGKLLVRCFKLQFSSVGLVHIGRYEGSLQEGFVLKDVVIKDLSYIPDALVRIQEVRVRLPLWDPGHSDFSIFNARILIPDSDPVVFTGEIYAGKIRGELYATSVDIHAASRFWTGDDIKKNLQGFISGLDLTVQGNVTSPRVNGDVLLDSIRYRAVHVSKVKARLNLMLLPQMRQWQLKGVVIVNNGIVNVHKKDLGLDLSRFVFLGDIFDPKIDIHLGSKVEDMSIHLVIRGTALAPQLVVTSDPPMPPQDALQVLFTGNAFSYSTSPFHGVTSNELADNFLDYSLQDVNANGQIGFKTKLTENLKLGAEMDQAPTSPGETNTYYIRKINGEMDMTDHMSLNISQAVMPQGGSAAYQDVQPQSETQVYVQYKKRF